MGSLPLGYLVVRLGLHCVYKVWELDGVLDEEHRYVVPDNIPDTFLRVKLGGEATNITDGILLHRRQQNE